MLLVFRRFIDVLPLGLLIKQGSVKRFVVSIGRLALDFAALNTFGFFHLNLFNWV